MHRFLKRGWGNAVRMKHIFHLLCILCSHHILSLPSPLRTQMCPSTLSFFSFTLNQSFQNLYQWHKIFMNSKFQSSSSSFTYLFKYHPFTTAIVLHSSLKIQTFSLWLPFHLDVHFLFLSCIVDWGLMIMMLIMLWKPWLLSIECVLYHRPRDELLTFRNFF